MGCKINYYVDFLFFLPAVGDFTDNVKRFFEVDRVRNYLQRQSDISIPWSLEDVRTGDK